MKCPGQDTRYWKPGAVFEAKCPECGEGVEFFKDDATRTCKKCGHKFLNPEMDFGCASYCKYAEQCLGNLPPELIAQQENLLKDRVAIEMKRYFKKDFRRIGQAMRRARYAEQLGKGSDGNLAVIIMAAYLLDMGAHDEKGKERIGAPSETDTEATDVPRALLTRLGAGAEIIQEVCDIITRHHNPRAEDDINFRIVHDADQLARLESTLTETRPGRGNRHAEREHDFLTEEGKRLAQEMLTRTP